MEVFALYGIGFGGRVEVMDLRNDLLSGAREPVPLKEAAARVRRGFLCACLACGLLAGAPGAALAGPQVRFREGSIVLTDGGKRFELKEMIDPNSFFETLHAVCRRDDSYFIVFGSSEMSRGWPPKGGNCGSGVESFIRWLHVRGGQVIEQQEGRYESCFRNRDGWDIQWRDGKLQWNCTGFRGVEGKPNAFEDVDLSWTFDPAHPEAGIVETEKVVDAAARR